MTEKKKMKVKYFDRLVKSMTEEESIRLKRLPYPEFLKTRYWKTVSKYVKYMAGKKCIVCDSNKKLRTHHKRYDNKGYEYIHWANDLICICNICHKKIHGIDTKKSKPVTRKDEVGAKIAPLKPKTGGRGNA